MSCFVCDRAWQCLQISRLEVRGHLFGREVQESGISLATTTDWAYKLLMESTYLPLMDCITSSGASAFFAVLCLLGSLSVVCPFQEIADRSGRVGVAVIGVNARGVCVCNELHADYRPGTTVYMACELNSCISACQRTRQGLSARVRSERYNQSYTPMKIADIFIF
ncbi:hypothetical protein BD413DRAFT_195787 [Trametes elegans]|nr:hypothetical protein BD413DRAFT_195787 [Trametes elegans]